jgi:hypothetical protein
MASPVWAHDTWFALQSRATAGVVLALGTGTRFPLQEFAIAPEHLQQIGCRQGDGRVGVAALTNAPTLTLRATPAGPAPLSCAAQLKPMAIELAPDKIPVYLDEIHASAAVREVWSRMQSRGIAWNERYTKHARIELAGAPAAADPATLQARPMAMGMDVLLESGLQPTHSGDTLVFQVLRDGKPLADFAVELRSTDDREAQWFKTDAQGRVRTAAPEAGRWILRGTDLRLSASRPGTWESRFVTLAFEVLPAP